MLTCISGRATSNRILCVSSLDSRATASCLSRTSRPLTCVGQKNTVMVKGHMKERGHPPPSVTGGSPQG